jgi:hypothetical protein
MRTASGGGRLPYGRRPPLSLTNQAPTSAPDRIEDADACPDRRRHAVAYNGRMAGIGNQQAVQRLWLPPLARPGMVPVLIVVGAALSRFTYRTPDGQRTGMFYSFEYTLDTLLPAISLRRDFDDVKIEGWPRYYFIVLKVCGYLFVAAIIQTFNKLSAS